MLLAAGGGLAPPLHQELLADGPDVVGLEAAAASDVAHAQVVGLAGKLVHVPPGQRGWVMT